MIALLEQSRKSRPSWWVDGAERDARAERRDKDSNQRDEVATARDEVAERRDVDAAAREQAAVDLTVATHSRLDKDDASAVNFELAHVEIMLGVTRAFDELAASMDRPPANLGQVRRELEWHLDQAYVAVLAIAEERARTRADLRGIAQHLDAACRDRLTAGQDRTAATADRFYARADRDHARNARQAAALDRAAP